MNYIIFNNPTSNILPESAPDPNDIVLQNHQWFYNLIQLDFKIACDRWLKLIWTDLEKKY